MQVLLALLCALMFIICDAFAANWAKTGSKQSLVYGAILVMVGYAIFAWLNKEWSLAQVGVFVNVTIAIGAVLVSFFFFKEQLAVIQWWGIGLGLISIYMLCTGN